MTADSLAARNLDLPAPDGQDRDTTWWRHSSGERIFVQEGQVYEPPYGFRSIDAVEQDAYAALAACAWARSVGGAC